LVRARRVGPGQDREERRAEEGVAKKWFESDIVKE
jgi:hypothetical protein